MYPVESQKNFVISVLADGTRHACQLLGRIACYTYCTICGLHVCVLGTPVSPAKTDEPIEMSYGMTSCV